jgi:hypothetical protein
MSKRDTHMPGPPVLPEPPGELVEIVNSLNDPAVTRIGLTTTADGRWALAVRVMPGTAVPVKAVEEAGRGYPVVYQEEPESWPVARPAYPDLDE